MAKKRLKLEEYVEGIKKGDRIVLSRAITLTESSLEEDNVLAEEVINQVIYRTGYSFRLGITGVPGVGKSTFIEAFGNRLVEKGHKLAVLAIDPSSQKTKGSILGDKTRMNELARNPDVYIRPSPTGKALGGVARKTRESMLLCEAAGYDFIIIETVGVGQSETAVHGMVDFFLLLMLAGAGDELQGIKKGIMEMADALAINKADEGNERAAEKAKKAYENALHLFPLGPNGWVPKVLTCSALERKGLEEVYKLLLSFKSAMQKNNYWEHKRAEQNLQWMEQCIQDHLLQAFQQNKDTLSLQKELRPAVKEGKQSAIKAARELIQTFWKSMG